MIDEDDDGKRLATAVVDRVSRAYPTVAIEWLPTTSYHGTLVKFTPANELGAPLWLYANFDWSFQLESDGLILFEDEPIQDSEFGQINRIMQEIAKVAENGTTRHGWFGRVLTDPAYRTGAWA